MQVIPLSFHILSTIRQVTMELSEIATRADIQSAKEEILGFLKESLSLVKPSNKKWLRSKEVREMLSLSSSGLQNFRINGTLPYTKIGGVIYYDYEEILKVGNDNRRNVI